MSNIVAITAFDGASTPVSHNFQPETVSRPDPLTTLATYKEWLAGVPDYAQGRVSIKKQKMKNGITRTATRVEIPVMEPIAGQNASGYTAAPKVAFVDTVEIVGYHHERSTTSGRKLVRQLALNIAGSIATSVTPATTGPVPELMDYLLSPT